MNRELNLISCPGAKKFSDALYKALKKKNNNTKLVKAEFPVFKNSETKCVLNEPVRGADVFIIQDVANIATGSVNDNIVSLLAAIDTANHASAEEVNLVLPTFPYSRQHKKTKREGLTAALWCHIFENMGVKRIITLDIHSREIQNAFSKTIMENLHASVQLVKTMKDDNVDFKNLVVVAPDSGAIDRNKYFSTNLHVPLAMLYKERDYSKITVSANDNNITSMKLIGEIDHSDILIADDLLDSGGTTLKAASFLKEKGANNIYIAISLPFFNDPAIEDFTKAYEAGIITKVYGTNAVHHPRLWKQPWFKKTNVVDLFSEVIWRTNERIGLSDLLEGSDEIREMLQDKSDTDVDD
jgi:ribose-phosphate pyrophosphokinase